MHNHITEDARGMVVNRMHSGVEMLVRLCNGDSVARGWWNRKVPNVGSGVETRVILEAAGVKFDDVVMSIAEASETVPVKLCLIHSEISEAMEGHRKDLADSHLPHRPSLEVELADAVIRIADLAGALGLDLAGAIVEKLEYNKQRADHDLTTRAGPGGKAY